MAEKVFSFVAEHGGVKWIKRHISYVYNFEKNVDNVKDQLYSLKRKRKRIEHAVDDATNRKLEVIESDVQHWLQSVATVVENAESLFEETERAKRRCLFGLCPNVKAMYQVGKKAEDKSKAVADLRLAAGQFSSVSYRPAPQGIRFAIINDYETFESRAWHLDKIMKALKDPNVNMIGVWGMGGVGKTTLVKKAVQQANLDRIFDVVVLSEVSLNQDLRRIQGEIADALGFKFEAETISGRSNQLHERLLKETKILVILDNIWARIDLGELGIPFGNDHKGCKILMTSRDRRVLTQIGTNSLKIWVDTLDDVEAWKLFEKIAGDVVKVPNLQPLAIEIAKRCAGLPLLITTVAMALSDRKDSYTWKEALQQLDKFGNDDFDAQVYSALELSFNKLKGKPMKEVFLLCGLLVNTNYAIEDLVKYCMTLDSFKHIDQLEDRRNKLHKLVIDLKSACLLLDGEKNGYIKMHDVVRKFALSFAREKHNMFIEEYDGELEEWPKKNAVVKFYSIYFRHNYIHRLLEGLECEELKLFILHSKNRDLEIPGSFFQGMRGIIVLEIKNIIIRSLPSSLCYLNNLSTLSLEECELDDIARIGNLVGLEVLRIVNSKISHFPEETRQLTRLKLFNVNGCSNLAVIPPNVISSFTRLEELYMEKSFVNWEAEGVNGQNACLAELNKLSKLTSLDIHIPNSNIMPNDLFSVKLERFKMVIGYVCAWSLEWFSKRYESSRSLKLKLSTSIHVKPGVKELLKKSEDLYLNELGGVNSVCELDREGFPRLRFLHVQEGRNFQYIVNPNTTTPCKIFPGLEVLSLKKLINLEMICHGQLGVESFSKLRIVRVESCGMLKNLFSFPIAKSLLQLQQIKVEDCKNMEEIFSCESEKDVIELKEVQSIELRGLPKLTSICSEIKDEPIPLLNGKIVFPYLVTLDLHDIGAEKIWDNSLQAMQHFHRLRYLTLSGCHKLKFLFPVVVVKGLIQLMKLDVRDCELMERIIGGAAGQMIFPKLNLLHLKDLPKLKRFCTGNSVEFPSLAYMWIAKCPELKSFIFDEKDVSNGDLPPPLFDEKVELPTIEILDIRSVNLKRIWHNELPPESFCKLDNLFLYDCENLLNIFPSNMLTRLQNLQILDIENCKSMDVIFDLEGPNGLEMHITKTPIFGKLKFIEIADCPSVRYIFPLSIISGLRELEKLHIEDCRAVEEIVAMEGVDADVRFEVLKVTFLKLEDLPQLKSFYPGIHTSEWPLLKKLKVVGCDKLKILASECSNVQEGAHDGYLYSHEKDKFLNMEELVVGRSTLNEIFPDGGFICEAGELSTFRSLNILQSQNFGCHRLKIQFPSSLLSFCNLIELKVYRCHKLTYLMSCSTTKSMMQLKKLRVFECAMMTSIVECAGESETEDDNIFYQLEQIYIDDMPNLSSFCCSGKHAFKLPSLVYVYVRNCPSLKTFCEGPLSTFKLWSLHVSSYEERWNGDLNSTIQALYKEMEDDDDDDDDDGGDEDLSMEIKSNDDDEVNCS
ncbi:probable disease resistance protein At4g27220 [Tripterygium wilfordii]|uniref:probable disease resistance protein At4g27220 n=1 Tax=Tripterygium wilfordii TaxID=458696 RepID=UPI0018F7F49D|nr:probable disease resistance protein At4g27220 [Tripterygium wilfordii]XP_038696979.1 probable disease resistance protein At4g27220 [Tripterygium wilfordii]XP_038696980.1 probable disease resistance protein At4g27220 [Tripterygium wilfordii]XP_038696981.1 probable disease resistance protein At4g27220 [Tripterygium wilfordii]XP_038696982.1 probable disease resistance protein At4g27220 [Tripterygium wilfordii]XP_038696984.1 probable disease resistance protein At4g27220 [Tripterygium wilfordii]